MLSRSIIHPRPEAASPMPSTIQGNTAPARIRRAIQRMTALMIFTRPDPARQPNGRLCSKRKRPDYSGLFPCAGLSKSGPQRDVQIVPLHGAAVRRAIGLDRAAVGLPCPDRAAVRRVVGLDRSAIRSSIGAVSELLSVQPPRRLCCPGEIRRILVAAHSEIGEM